MRFFTLCALIFAVYTDETKCTSVLINFAFSCILTFCTAKSDIFCTTEMFNIQELFQYSYIISRREKLQMVVILLHCSFTRD